MTQQLHSDHQNTLPHRAISLSQSVPQVVISSLKTARHFRSGDHVQRRHGAGQTFWQFQHYTNDMDARRIDWRQSARGDHLYVRQKQLENAQTYTIWASNAPSMHYQSRKATVTKHDAAQILTLAIAHIMTRNHDTVQSHDRLISGHTAQTIYKLHDHMNAHDASLPVAIKPVQTDTTAIFAGDFLKPIQDIKTTLNPYFAKTSSGVLIHILDPAEVDLPFRGHVKFQSVTGAVNTLIQSVRGVRGEYQSALDKHCTALKTLCCRNGWHYIRHVTDRDMKQALLNILNALQNGGRT